MSGGATGTECVQHVIGCVDQQPPSVLYIRGIESKLSGVTNAVVGHTNDPRPHATQLLVAHTRKELISERSKSTSTPPVSQARIKVLANLNVEPTRSKANRTKNLFRFIYK